MRLFALFGLAFASASRERLTSPHTANSPAHSSKGTPSPSTGCPVAELRLLVGSRFQVLFHSPPGVLFTFPSRYWFTIGRQGVLSLRGWSPQIHTGFPGSGATRDHREEAGHVSSTGLLPSVTALSMAFDYVPALSLLGPSDAGPCGSHDPDQATTSVYDT
jgi:hypothetical protein